MEMCGGPCQIHFQYFPNYWTSLRFHEHLCKSSGSLSKKPHLDIEENIFPGIMVLFYIKKLQRQHILTFIYYCYNTYENEL